MITTVNNSRQHISTIENYYTPEIIKFLNDSFDKFSKEYPDVEDFRTNVIFYWHGYPVSPDSVQKILLGVRTVPDGLTMKFYISNGNVH